MNDALREVFPGCPEVEQGYAYVNDKPGLGIDINEALAAKFPVRAAILAGRWPAPRTAPSGVPK